MTMPLIILAVFACPARLRRHASLAVVPELSWWPHRLAFDFAHLFRAETLAVIGTSALLVGFGIGLGWMLYGAWPAEPANRSIHSNAPSPACSLCCETNST